MGALEGRNETFSFALPGLTLLFWIVPSPCAHGLGFNLSPRWGGRRQAHAMGLGSGDARADACASLPDVNGHHSLDLVCPENWGYVIMMKVFGLFSVLLAAASAWATAPHDEPIVKAVEKVRPAVVNIFTERIVLQEVRDPRDVFFERYFGVVS